MSCVAPEQLAAAASGDTSDEARAALAHALTCERCAALLAEQRELRSLAGYAASPSLDRDRRAAMAVRIAQADIDVGASDDCLALEVLAEAALDEIDPPHVATCERCADLLEEQREIRALARQAARDRREASQPETLANSGVGRDGALDELWPRLDTGRRDELAAEVMARADALPRQRRRDRMLIAGVALAAAAAIVVIVATRSGGRAEPIVLDDVPLEIPKVKPKPTVEPIEGPKVEPIVEDDLAAAPPAVVVPTTGAQLSRETSPTGGDVVKLRDGGVTIDAAKSSAVVIAGATRVDVSRARASIVARRGVVETVQVFAGAVEVTSGGKKQIVHAGAVWRAELVAAKPDAGSPDGSGVPPVEPTAQVALRAFRDGWTLLRANKHHEAIAAFDRATDPVVAEDATFWAAVAAERAGDRADAARRFAEFIARFPASPRIDSAREAARRLVK